MMVKCLNVTDADANDEDVGMCIVVWRLNDSFINVQHGNVTTTSCFILRWHPT